MTIKRGVSEGRGAGNNYYKKAKHRYWDGCCAKLCGVTFVSDEGHFFFLHANLERISYHVEQAPLQ
jgi:hypothetical protein